MMHSRHCFICKQLSVFYGLQLPRVPMQGLSNVVPPPPPHDGNVLLAPLPSVHESDSSLASVGGAVSADGVLDVSSPTLIGGVMQPDFVSSFGSIAPLRDNFTWITPGANDTSAFTATHQHDHSSCCHYGLTGRNHVIAVRILQHKIAAVASLHTISVQCCLLIM